MTSDTSRVVSAPLLGYSPAVQERASAELDSLPTPCSRDQVFKYLDEAGRERTCSAVSRMVIDYGWTRDKIRAGKKRPEM